MREDGSEFDRDLNSIITLDDIKGASSYAYNV